MCKPSVLYVLEKYPQISETYIKTELEAVRDEYDITVVSRYKANVSYENHLPYRLLEDEAIEEAVRQINPDVIHSHWLKHLYFVGPLAIRAGVPFTVRSHSFDTISLRARGPSRLRGLVTRDRLVRQRARIRHSLRWLNHELCRGVLAFPFARPYLEAGGVHPDKIVDCYPAIDHRLFDDRSPNGDGVMNVGAAGPKKGMEAFIELASRVPEKQFDLYALGYDVEKLR
ncbi:MAG: hypothetical protein JRG95_22240, partial [Deltaproteobacteria bacterium]|nr:hypothetical protein [Deltaproteobacteria bacterium]